MSGSKVEQLTPMQQQLLALDAERRRKIGEEKHGREQDKAHSKPARAVGSPIEGTRRNFPIADPEAEIERLRGWLDRSEAARQKPADERPPLEFPSKPQSVRPLLHVRTASASDAEVSNRDVRVFFIGDALHAERADGEARVLEIIGTVDVNAPYRGRAGKRVAEIANVSGLSEPIRQLNAAIAGRVKGEHVTFPFRVERSALELEREARRIAAVNAGIEADPGALLQTALSVFHRDATERFLKLFEDSPTLHRQGWDSVYTLALEQFGMSIAEQPWRKYVKESDLLIEAVEQVLELETAKAARVVEHYVSLERDGARIPMFDAIEIARQRIERDGIPEALELSRKGSTLQGYDDRKRKWKELGFETAREVVYWMATNEADECERALRAAFRQARYERPVTVRCHCRYEAKVPAGVLETRGMLSCPDHGPMRVEEKDA